jgi:hypothetical protein
VTAKRPLARAARVLITAAAICVLGLLAAGCSSAAKNAISSFSPTRSATASPPSPTGGSATSEASAQPGPPTATTTVTAPAPAPLTVTPSATEGTAAPASEPNSPWMWLWLALGAAAFIGLIAWIAHAMGRRSTVATDRHSQLASAYAKGSALADAMRIAETPGALAAADAGMRWSDIQRRADDLAQTLYALRDATPNEQERMRVADALASLQAARSAMESERAPGGGPAQAAIVQDRLAFFDACIQALRAPDRRPV